MKPVVIKEASKIWSRLSKDVREVDLEFELDVNKRLLSFFQVGDYYYFIFNLKKTLLEFVSADVTRVLGYDTEEFDLSLLMSLIHPDDQPYFLNFENKATEFFFNLGGDVMSNYKISYDYRIKKKDGSYIRILQQITTLQFDENKGVLRTFGVHTDITHLKPVGVPLLSFIGLNGLPSYINVDVKESYKTTKAVITKREQQILHLMAQGKNSEEICKALFISKQTVDTHRKNMLRKTGCSNTAALMLEAIKRGWI